MRAWSVGTSSLIVFLASIGSANAGEFAIHLSGMCSTGWVSGNTQLGEWPGVTSIDASVDQTRSLSEAALELAAILDQHCTGDDSCFVYNYSAGDLLLNYLLSNSADDRWNIDHVVTTGGAGGGSNLASPIATVFTCDYVRELSETNARSSYNHNDTGGTMVYRLGGHRSMFRTSLACGLSTAIGFLSLGLANPGACLNGKSDGAVEYHSSGAYNEATGWPSFWGAPESLHWGSGYHQSYWDASSGDDVGDDLNHYQIQNFGLCLEGGIAGVQGYAACVEHMRALY